MKAGIGSMCMLMVLLFIAAGEGVAERHPSFLTYGYDGQIDLASALELTYDANGAVDGYAIAGRTNDIYATAIGLNYRGGQEWEWQLDPEGALNPLGNAVDIINVENGLVTVGWVTTATGEEIFIARLSEDGTLQWINVFGGAGSQRGTGLCARFDPDTEEFEGYAVSAYNEANLNVMLILLDPSGNIEATYGYNKVCSGMVYKPSGVIQTADGGYALGGLAGVPHWYPNVGFGFLLKVNSSGSEQWCHLCDTETLNGGAYGRCVVQRPNGNYYLLGLRADNAYDYYPEVAVIEISQLGALVGSPRVYREIADAVGEDQSFAFSLEPFKVSGELMYAVCGEMSDPNEEFDVFMMSIDDLLNIESLDFEILQYSLLGTSKLGNNRPCDSWVACKVYEVDHYAIAASTDYNESPTIWDIYFSRNGFDFYDNGVEACIADAETSRMPSLAIQQGCSRGATITVDLPEAGSIKLSVFDISGRVIRTIRDGFEEAGTTRFEWNGTDECGNSAPSGVYFVNIRTGNGADSARLLLI